MATQNECNGAARYMIQVARAAGIPEHEIEAWSTDSKIEARTGLPETAAQDVRDAIAEELS